ncbi:hypothetical protein EXIGLDRAFT_729044 [Exidia glandulosa HHB12029]|uniref:Amidohydrolase-related domain-containing protein n=1 Tax=Exidia glandulosa HHB12029 TaxID=1314781 RepID=A0A165ZIJ2_EXIGL|nr:hypothetical protein EXIGLDRAFT_729044 [Exidia glandulosa HHB12029]
MTSKVHAADVYNNSPRRPTTAFVALLTAAAFSISFLFHSPAHVQNEAILARCAALHTPVRPSSDFRTRTTSDRYVPGTRAVLVKNATIWDGEDVLPGDGRADVFLDGGIVKFVGDFSKSGLEFEGVEYDTLDAGGAWVTPGLVDMHSHIGSAAAPSLRGASGGGVRNGPVLPWLRALDTINTHDAAYELSVAGGVSTSLVLPGSGNAIGGQGFVIKLRPTVERTPFSKLLEPPFTYNGSGIEPANPPRWRYLKQACGENPSRAYSYTRMDNIWAFRSAYNEARKVKEAQDLYCAKAQAGQWDELADSAFPESLQWEMLVDVLRGRVKVNTHCYEATDLDGLVRLSNEFKFEIAAFHHASETYLVPDLLKKAYGKPPASALFSTNMRYKREAYRGSEFAPRILAENGLRVIMKSDHPVLDSRYLLYEAQTAHYYGLSASLALASVTSTPADVLGLSHRIGYIRKGYDADLVIWDAHPLALSATPKQVVIDGIPQLKPPHAHTVDKPAFLQRVPKTPNFDKEAKEAVEYEGLPPLVPRRRVKSVAFVNVSAVYTHELDEQQYTSGATVLVEGGEIVWTCTGTGGRCSERLQTVPSLEETVDLQGGVLGPALISYGAPLGLTEIPPEMSTSDGIAPDALMGVVPPIVGGEGTLVRAVDGLQFSGRDILLAYRSGVTSGITAPLHAGVIGGLSVAFSTGAAHKLEDGAIRKGITALHVSLAHVGQPSVSTQIALLRRLLKGHGTGDVKEYFDKAARGEIPLVVDVDNADVIATLLELKAEVEDSVGQGKMKLVLAGAAEAHLLAKQIAAADVGVILVPSRSFPHTWDQRRHLPGLPLSEDTAVSLLLSHNITVGLGIVEQWSARSTRFDVAWAYLDAGGKISKKAALALASKNLAHLLGVEHSGELVAYAGGDLLDISSKVVAVLSSDGDYVDLW